MHLLEDLPTPASAWGGINLFWPSTNYVGGYGKIWWWNNYDIFLVVVAVLVVNTTVLFLFQKQLRLRAMITTLVFSSGVLLSVYQMNHRPVDFAYSGSTSRYSEMERQSKELQKELLGTRLYNVMARLDRRLPFYF